MRTRRIAPLLATFALVIAGCGDGAPGMTATFTPGGDFGLRVSAESGVATPTYSWDGVEARSLVVVRVSDGFLMWRVDALDASQGFRGPVQHGVTPPAASEAVEEALLTADEDYEVTLTTVAGETGSLRFTL